WLYTLLFPGYKQSLRCEMLFQVLEPVFNISQRIWQYELCEDKYLIADEEYDYDPHIESTKDAAISLLRKGKNYSCEFYNADIVINCGFEVFSPKNNWNFHINAGGPFRKYINNIISDPSNKLKYTNLLKNSMRSVNAAYALFSIEIPETFADYFIEIDEKRFFDSDYLTKYSWSPIYEIWVDHQSGGREPQGLPLHPGVDIGDGFIKYHINYSSMHTPKTCGLCGYHM
ncbi:MAG: hypothetical protein ACAI44_32370, partial [Candidatus Sericytochromatia bacterium]